MELSCQSAYLAMGRFADHLDVSNWITWILKHETRGTWCVGTRFTMADFKGGEREPGTKTCGGLQKIGTALSWQQGNRSLGLIPATF